MRSLDQALRDVADAFGPTPSERVELLGALGRFVADAEVAREDAPPFDNSAMDGFAVRASELVGASESAPVTLPLTTESRAGGGWPAPLPLGHAAPIFTGAPLPEGADAIVVREDSERGGAEVALRFAPSPGHHVRRRGEDVRVGDSLAEPGALVDGGLVALLASQGVREIAVHRRPRVAVLVTGDELRESSSRDAGTILDSNGPMIAALVREAGGEPLVLPRAADDFEALVAAVTRGIDSDLLVTTGGVSVGDHDHVRGALEKAGVTLDFWKVALKPGKPLVFGTLEGRGAALGLPGNPVSAFVTFHLFVRPAIRRLLGDPRPWPTLRRARLTSPLTHTLGRTELFRVRVEQRADGEWATPHARQGSGALISIGAADALAILPAGTARLDAGDEVWLWPLRGGASEPGAVD